jgi:hypothetical protein
VLPLMDGTATVGTSTNFAREGHIHPTDTSRAAVTYVDAQDALKVAKAGDTMTGLLVLSADPSAALGAATKQYADTKVAKAGDVMTGELIIRASPAWLALDKLASGTTSAVIGSKAGFSRWEMDLGDATAEAGGNVGSDFAIARYTDAGVFINVPLTIKRQDGTVLLGVGPACPNLMAAQVCYAGSPGGGIGFRGTDNGYACIFASASGTFVGNIFTTTTTTSYATSSDDRLKEDLKSFDAGNIVDDTKVYDFKWKSTGERAYGVIAQQAIEVYPTAVVNTDDQWAIDYSKYVPVLLQELKALRARVAALEGGGLSGKPA